MDQQMIVKPFASLSVRPKTTQEGVRLVLEFFRLDSLRRNCGETMEHWTRRFTLQYTKAGQKLNTSISEIRKTICTKTLETSCWLNLQV